MRCFIESNSLERSTLEFVNIFRRELNANEYISGVTFLVVSAISSPLVSCREERNNSCILHNSFTIVSYQLILVYLLNCVLLPKTIVIILFRSFIIGSSSGNKAVSRGFVSSVAVFSTSLLFEVEFEFTLSLRELQTRNSSKNSISFASRSQGVVTLEHSVVSISILLRSNEYSCYSALHSEGKTVVWGRANSFSNSSIFVNTSYNSVSFRCTSHNDSCRVTSSSARSVQTISCSRICSSRSRSSSSAASESKVRRFVSSLEFTKVIDTIQERVNVWCWVNHEINSLHTYGYLNTVLRFDNSFTVFILCKSQISNSCFNLLFELSTILIAIEDVSCNLHDLIVTLPSFNEVIIRRISSIVITLIIVCSSCTSSGYSICSTSATRCCNREGVSEVASSSLTRLCFLLILHVQVVAWTSGETCTEGKNHSRCEKLLFHTE